MNRTNRPDPDASKNENYRTKFSTQNKSKTETNRPDPETSKPRITRTNRPDPDASKTQNTGQSFRPKTSPKTETNRPDPETSKLRITRTNLRPKRRPKPRIPDKFSTQNKSKNRDESTWPRDVET